MIQVCSRCGTRWNVRDRRRAWCPRCNGALWAPLTDAQEAELAGLAGTAQGPRAAPGAGPQSGEPVKAPKPGPPGYRWIAVRPGPPPPPRPRRRPLGPTPRYTVIPRWTLMQRPDPAARGTLAKSAAPSERLGPSVETVRKMMVVTMAVLGAAALAQVLVYALLIVNRTILLHRVIAGAAQWLAGLTGLAAIAAVIGCAVVLTRWLIARRTAVFAGLHLPESRPRWALWAGCLVPLVNLAWAPVYAIEVAIREGQLSRLRKPIMVWWLVWALATAVTVLATATSRAQDAQGIANNTVATMIAYLSGAAAVAALVKVVDGFERRAVRRPAHRWVVVADDPPADHRDVPRTASNQPAGHRPAAGALEPDGREPAA